MPDVQGRNLIDAGTGMSMTDFNRSKVGFGDGVWSLAFEEVDAVRDFLVGRVCNGFDQGVEGCRFAAVGLLSFGEGVDNSLSLIICQA